LKRFLGVFLLCSVVAPYTGTYIWLQYEKKQVKREIKQQLKAGLDRKEFVILYITKNESAELKWEHSKEFEYKGEMYDIIETAISGDTTFYTCWWDHEETKLNRHLKLLVAQALGNDQQNKDNSKKLFDFSKLVFQHGQVIDFNFHLESGKLRFSHCPIHEYLYKVPTPSPPPWFS